MYNLLFDLCDSFISEQLYLSALSLAEYLYSIKPDIEILCKIVYSMYHLGYTGQVIKTVEEYPELGEFYEIRKVYFLSISKKILKFTEPCTRKMHIQKSKLNPESVLTLLSGLKQTNQKTFLVEAFTLDNRNLEALIILSKDSLMPQDKVLVLLSDINPELKGVFVNILYENSYQNIFSPISYFSFAKKLYYDKNSDRLFQLGSSMVEGYKDSEYSYFILGMYFLLKERLDDAKACFYQSLNLNNSFGEGWIGYGVVNSSIKECLNATNCFEKAFEKMPGSHKPALYLGFEYHKMNNTELAEIWYKKALEIKVCSVAVQKFSSFLIQNGRIDEALKILEYQNSQEEEILFKNGISLKYLKIFCLIKKENLREAEILLQKSSICWRFYALQGFIKQLQGYLEDALINYHECLLRMKKTARIEDLMSQALDCLAGKTVNRAIEYSNTLFEALDLKSLGIVYI